MNPKAIILTGYGINCDYETDHALKLAGFESKRVHINDLIFDNEKLENYHLLVVDGGFSWADDHGAGVLLGAKLKNNLGQDIQRFIQEKKLIIGICNGFQAIINMGILPGFDGNYSSREVALVSNDCGNFRDQWVHMRANQDSPCVFTKGISRLDLPVRHGEGKFYASSEVISKLKQNNQIVLQYSAKNGLLASGKFPANPNGSLEDIAAICDPIGRIMGIMPHPEAFLHYTNHPDWTRQKIENVRNSQSMNRFTNPQSMGRLNPFDSQEDGDGIKLFRNAAEYIKENLLRESGGVECAAL